MNELNSENPIVADCIKLAERDRQTRWKSELPASICYVAFVQWEYEDKLPADINRPHFDAMFELSKVDGVRLYPFIQWNGQRIYLGAT